MYYQTTQTYIGDALIREWQKLVDGGETITSLSKRYPYSRYTITRALKHNRIGYKVNYGRRIPPEKIAEIRRLYEANDLSQTQIAKEMGVDAKTVSKYTRNTGMSKYYKPKDSLIWKAEEVQYVIDYYDATTMKDLGYALNKTKNQVQSKVQVLIERGVIQPKGMGNYTRRGDK